MNVEIETGRTRREHIAVVVSAVTAILFAAVVAGGIVAGRLTLVVVVAFGFLAMVAGVTISLFVDFGTPDRQVWAYGLASGAMLASAAALLAPKAITRHPEYGGFAIALGYLAGYAGHELGHLVTHYDLPLNAAVSELTLHAFAAGSIMGVVYGSLPDLSALFGFGILAHKFPAGFTGSEALKQSGIPRTIMIVPASAVALAAIPLSILTPDLSATVQAVFYGVSTGVFAHVGIDMLPECSHVGSHADSSGHGSIECSRNIHRVRQYAVASTFAGAGAIFVLWQALAMG
ncbi:ZIP family metal transporter [Halorhabdus amylolytica]|uniref:ZIP family metal transporter n=1 Tax=Halorhabdus amylolytica TaxID=2559573 RepID=UPI0010A9B211|nr:ZIP family metal transporter [Halorhabdus amylolytica]